MDFSLNWNQEELRDEVIFCLSRSLTGDCPARMFHKSPSFGSSMEFIPSPSISLRSTQDRLDEGLRPSIDLRRCLSFPLIQ